MSFSVHEHNWNKFMSMYISFFDQDLTESVGAWKKNTFSCWHFDLKSYISLSRLSKFKLLVLLRTIIIYYLFSIQLSFPLLLIASYWHFFAIDTSAFISISPFLIPISIFFFILLMARRIFFLPMHIGTYLFFFFLLLRDIKQEICVKFPK